MKSKGIGDVLSLQRQIQELNVQNQALLEKLNAEENRRKSAEKSQVLFLLVIPETVSTTRADRKLQRLPGGFVCKIPTARIIGILALLTLVALPNRETPTHCTWNRSWTASKWFWISKPNSSTSRRRR